MALVANKTKPVLSWILQAIISIQFALSGLEKFVDPENWERRFQNWGYPDNFFLIIGAAELALAMIMLLPKTARVGSIATIVFMTGAAITHLRAGDGHYWVAVVTGILAGCLFFLRARQAPSPQ